MASFHIHFVLKGIYHLTTGDGKKKMPKEWDARTVSIGRNLFQRGSPARIGGTTCVLVRQRLTVEEASELAL